MGLIVQKYGGTSVATVERIQAVAQGHSVVVMSAMGQTTDELLALARAVTPNPPAWELDMLLATEDCSPLPGLGIHDWTGGLVRQSGRKRMGISLGLWRAWGRLPWQGGWFGDHGSALVNGKPMPLNKP